MYICVNYNIMNIIIWTTYEKSSNEIVDPLLYLSCVF